VGERQRAGQKTTKATVIRYMKENKLSSRETTHNLIRNLINEGKLNKEEINSQVHFLTINYENEFIWINNALVDIYDFIDRCEKTTKKLHMSLNNLPKLSRHSELQYVLFLQKFIPPINIILHKLLLRTNRTIELEKDSQILNKRIIDLMLKLGEMPLYAPDSEDPLKLQTSQIYSGIDEINSDIHTLKRLSSKQNLTLLPEYDKLTNDFKQMAENFMKEFISTLRAYGEKHGLT
jgi:hypothetical protein